MDDVKQQIVDRLKQANNILVTVRNDPSIDLLSACIGMALVLSKLDKHAAAVFSGEVPSAMEFLKPEETLEPTTNSLRDFIISLDKTKADKLRYKVEDKVVRIFITPYRTSLSQDDLEFSQGDFNIDVVVALGVKEQAELDAAITAHGRILHDATVVSINNTGEGSLGSLNWQQPGVSSVSEMVADLAQALGAETLDAQIATALLTGVVAETQRFSNDKTTPQTMRVAGELMAAGANQQLVANELQADAKAVPHDDGDKPADDGTLDIAHAAPEPKVEVPAPELPKPVEASNSSEVGPVSEIKLQAGAERAEEARDGEDVFTASGHDDAPSPRSYLVDQASAPAAGTQPSEFAAAREPNGPDGAPMPFLSHDQPATPSVASEPSGNDAASFAANPSSSSVQPADTTATEASSTPSAHDGQTLDQIEASIGAHAAADNQAPAMNTLDDARSQVLKALNQGPQPLDPPIAALNANPFPPLHEDDAQAPAGPSAPPEPIEPTKPTAIEVDDEGNVTPAAPPSGIQPMDLQLPPIMPPVAVTSQPQQATGTPPPPEPPPLMPPTFMSPPSNNAF